MNNILIISSNKPQNLVQSLKSYGYDTTQASCSTINKIVKNDDFHYIIVFFSKQSLSSFEKIKEFISLQKELISAIAIIRPHFSTLKAQILSNGFDVCLSLTNTSLYDYEDMVIAQIEAHKNMYERNVGTSKTLSHCFSFTPREKDILALIEAGYTSDKDIAKQLHISLRTVECHMFRIRRKTSMNRMEICTSIYEYGL